MMLGAGGRGRARGHGRSRGRGDGTLPKPPSHSREFASVVGGALMPKRRGGAAMAEVLEEEQPEPSFSDPSSIELDDEHIAEEIKEQTIEQLLIVHHFVKSDWYNFETLVAQIKDKTKK